MKLDYNFIKQILLIMEEYDSHEIECNELMQAVGIIDNKRIINEKLIEKFIGHIKIFGDKYFIESSDTKGNYGFAKGAHGDYVISNPNYRITAQGYEFLDVLKNDTVLNKIKNFAISNAWEIGKQLLVQYAIGQVK